jgi:hypothetical protein
MSRGNAGPTRSKESSPDWLAIVRGHVESLRFGTVQITVHDSKVVQIERNEKTRLDRLQ